MQCAQCGSELPQGARFCSNCGRPGVATDGGITVGNVRGTGIAIGHQATATVEQGVSGAGLERLFAAIYQGIERRPDDLDVDREELRHTVRQVELEAAKGEQANPKKIERWLRALASVAPDVLDVTLAALVNPVAGAALGVRKLAERMRAAPRAT
jgi:zinc-ribbon domain